MVVDLEVRSRRMELGPFSLGPVFLPGGSLLSFLCTPGSLMPWPQVRPDEERLGGRQERNGEPQGQKERDKEIQGRKTERHGHGRGVYANTCWRKGKETDEGGPGGETQYTEAERGRGMERVEHRER